MNRRQAIIWINADPVHWRIYAAMGADGLMCYMWIMLISSSCDDFFLSNPGVKTCYLFWSVVFIYWFVIQVCQVVTGGSSRRCLFNQQTWLIQRNNHTYNILPENILSGLLSPIARMSLRTGGLILMPSNEGCTLIPSVQFFMWYINHTSH